MNALQQISRIYYNNVNDFLGNPNKRYLAKRFSDINFEMTDLTFGVDTFKSSVLINKAHSIAYNHKKHFGSIEAVSIAATLIEIFIIGRFQIEDKDLDNLKVNEINFTVKKAKESSKFESTVSYSLKKESNTLFEFISNVQNFKIKFLIEIPFILRKSWDIMKIDQFLDTLPKRYNFKGYKDSKLDIQNLFLDINNKQITSSFSVLNKWPNKGLIVGNSKELSHIDFIRISGQLIQTLLYNLEGISREEASNMWVKNLTIKPAITSNKQVEISFSQFSSLKLNSEKWRLFTSLIKIGHLEGSMKLCHKLN